jgi:energy-coupling factor transporter ATP-binding protein EcfA2
VTRLDLYYRAGMAAWADEWISTLNLRRYGLTVLTGAPGTGKTTLLRSLAHWLVDSHVFYFMPAARFASVESGEIVSFWAGENRDSKLRKVLILEDAESVLLRRADDNREKVATLLNLTDGMLGDALGLHVVCTLNSELTDLDPALLRPGRLVAHREFDLLTTEEAGRLAAALGLPPPTGERVSLAEFFNQTAPPALTRPTTPRRDHGLPHRAIPDRRPGLTATRSGRPAALTGSRGEWRASPRPRRARPSPQVRVDGSFHQRKSPVPIHARVPKQKRSMRNPQSAGRNPPWP